MARRTGRGDCQKTGKEIAINFRRNQNNNGKKKMEEGNRNNSSASYMKNYCGGEMLSTYLKLISARIRRRPNNISWSYS